MFVTVYMSQRFIRLLISHVYIFRRKSPEASHQTADTDKHLEDENGRHEITYMYDDAFPVQTGSGGHVVAPSGEEYATVDRARKWRDADNRESLTSNGEDNLETTLVENSVYGSV